MTPNLPPEPSEHLGFVVPNPGGSVIGTTFFHYIPIDVVLDARTAPYGDQLTYMGDEGQGWVVTVHSWGYEFVNEWKGGSRSFCVERGLL